MVLCDFKGSSSKILYSKEKSILAVEGTGFYDENFRLNWGRWCGHEMKAVFVAGLAMVTFR